MIPKSDVGTRYVNLYKEIERLAATTGVLFYMEVGVFDGTRALNLAKHLNEVAKNTCPMLYDGFDLFEDADPARDAHEILKTKPAPACAEVYRKLWDSGEFNDVTLVRGNTRETLTRYAREPHPDRMDLVFIDGGHSLETIESDWAAVQKILLPGAVVLFDDYLEDRTDAGAKPLVDRLAQDPEWAVKLLHPINHYPHTKITTRIARVTRAKA